MKNSFLLILLLCSANAFSQAPAIQWEKSFGGSNDDRGYFIQQTTDGGYIVAGSSLSNDGDVTGNHGSSDFWIVKLNGTGAIQWQKSLGGSQIDLAWVIQQTLDGGYIITGYSTSNDVEVSGNHGMQDYWVVKINDTGAIQWQRSLGGSGGEFSYSIQQTSDSGYIVAGESMSYDGDVTGNHGNADYWLLKLNATGATQWQKCLGGSGDDEAMSIRQTSGGGYVVTGQSASYNGDVSGNHGNWDYWVAKLNDTGAIQWQKSLGGSNVDVAASIQQTTDGGYIVAGFSSSNDGNVSGNHGGEDEWIVKLNDTGAIQWQKCLGGSGTDAPWVIQQTLDGGYVIAGQSISNDGQVSGNHGGQDYWIVKLNDTGAIQWQKSLGGSGNDVARSIQQTPDGGYIVAGYSQSGDGDVTGNHGGNDYWIVKLSCGINAGSISGAAVVCFDSTISLTDTATGGTWRISNSNATLSGSMVTGVSAGGDTAFYSITNTCGTATASFPFTIVNCATLSDPIRQPTPVTILPNPTTGNISVTGVSNVNIWVYNILGQLIKEADNTDHTSIDVFPPDLYFVKVFTDKGAIIKQGKIIKQ